MALFAVGLLLMAAGLWIVSGAVMEMRQAHESRAAHRAEHQRNLQMVADRQRGEVRPC